MKIWAHTIVCNEDRFLWFAVLSVIDYVDKVMIWDTGSEDKTPEVIKEIIKTHGDKIIFEEVGKVDKFQFTRMRQKMLDKTEADWILILDGDEIWPQHSIKKVVEVIKKKGEVLNAIAVPFYNLVGDIYHRQPEQMGQYEMLGKKGFLTIRAINRKVPGLHVDLPYGKEGYFDESNMPIQDLPKVEFVDAPYLHATHLVRSSAAEGFNKVKYELGAKLHKDFKYPEVFYKSHPDHIADPLKKRNFIYLLISFLSLPITYFKRWL